MSGTLYLVRHGRTKVNAEGRFRGRCDVPLDEVGLAEAGRAARMLSGSGAVALASSPLIRSTQTAEVLAAALGLPVQIDPGLVDLDHGDWTGLTPEEAAARDPEAFACFRSEPLRSTPPGGEALADTLRRTRAALRDLVERHGGAPVVAVSHEVPIRLVLADALGVRDEALWRHDVPTGSVSVLEASGQGFRVRAIGRTG
ncbi:MAG TPA: histidine phosphatase family protein [Actinomycetota bacterium]|nr:histidine phosphatase family protein [Actinomycetota bacterium]